MDAATTICSKQLLLGVGWELTMASFRLIYFSAPLGSKHNRFWGIGWLRLATLNASPNKIIRAFQSPFGEITETVQDYYPAYKNYT